MQVPLVLLDDGTFPYQGFCVPSGGLSAFGTSCLSTNKESADTLSGVSTFFGHCQFRLIILYLLKLMLA